MMKILKTRKKFVSRLVAGLMLLLFIIVLISFCGRSRRNQSYTLEIKKTIDASTDAIDTVSYTEKGLRFWDRNNLAYYTPAGEEELLLTNPSLGRVFFVHDHIYAVNHMTQDITMFDQKGNQAGYIAGGGYNVFAINSAGEFDVVHRKTPDGEVLDYINAEGELSPLLSTSEFILCYDMQKADDYVVATMVTKEKGYRSRITWTMGENIRHYDLENEVVMKLFLRGNDIYAITNEHLYWFRNENKENVDVSLFKQAYWEDSRIWILHGDVLESFDRRLNSESKVVPAINGFNFLRHQGISYIYSGMEIMAYPDKSDAPNLFYKTKFTIEDMQMTGNTLAVVHADHIDLLNIVEEKEPVAPKVEDTSPSTEVDKPEDSEPPVEDAQEPTDAEPTETEEEP